MDNFNFINNLHTPTKFPINYNNINNNSSTINWEKEGFINDLSMDMEHHQHHHHHHHQQQQQQNYHHHHQVHHPHMPIHDHVWNTTTYHNLPTTSSTPIPPPPSSSSSSSPFTIKPFSLQEQILEENEEELEEEEELGAMKEMMYRIAVMQPVDIDPASIRKPKRRNVRISNDPQSVAARHRRERISEKIRILQRLVPGGTKMDTASMLDEAIRYVKFLKRQIRQFHQQQQQQQQSGSSNHHQQPPVPALPPSDWPPSTSIVRPSSSSGHSKGAVFIRDSNNDEGLMVYQQQQKQQHGGN